MEQVSGYRSKLGALTKTALSTREPGLETRRKISQSAESQNRDWIWPERIMQFTKNMILQRAATAMLAQANMAPQSVLQLLG